MTFANRLRGEEEVARSELSVCVRCHFLGGGGDDGGRRGRRRRRKGEKREKEKRGRKEEKRRVAENSPLKDKV